MRNLPDRARTPSTQHQLRQPCLTQTTHPGVLGFRPHYAVLAHSCVGNANAHKNKGGRKGSGILIMTSKVNDIKHGELSLTFWVIYRVDAFRVWDYRG